MTHPFSFTASEADNSPTAAKVAEVFLTAGHAFQKLGDLALKLNQPISENTNETKWSEKDVDRLKEALSRFASDLDNISESVQGRIVQKIKTDIKRKTLMADSRAPLNTSYSGAMNAGNVNRTSGGYGASGGSYASNGGSGYSMSQGASTSLGGGDPTGGSIAHGGGRLMDIKHDEYGNAPPILNAQGVPRSVQTGSGNGLKRNVSPSASMYGSSGVHMTQRPYMGGNVGPPPYKKAAYGGGTTFRPIRTINAMVNPSPGGGHNIQLARPGATPQQQRQQQFMQQQQPRQPELLGGVLELEDSPPRADKEEARDSISPNIQQQI